MNSPRLAYRRVYQKTHRLTVVILDLLCLIGGQWQRLAIRQRFVLTSRRPRRRFPSISLYIHFV
ncbi:hypothetical protein KCP78_08965 [Salmonella enterica subsp. enterica]|nr:hypothetical protein KCP78_08965 [Salmonella enterica subsp. enterica]